MQKRYEAIRASFVDELSAKEIAHKFGYSVDAKITITSDTVQVKFGKKSFNPLIMDFVNSLPKIKIPWMNNRTLEYAFE